MSPQTKVLYLVYREGLAPVLQSVALVPQEMLRARGWDTRMLFFTPLGEFVRPALRRQWERARAEIKSEFGGPVYRLPSCPSRLRGCWNEGAVLEWWAARRYDAGDSLIVHARGPEAALLGLSVRTRFPQTRVVFDMRGLLHAEVAPRSASTDAQERAAACWYQKEKQSARECDALICVSRRMAEFVVNEFNVPPGKVALIPNCVELERFRRAAGEREAMRRTLDLSDKFVLVYSGTLRWWQQPDVVVSVFKAVKKAHPAAHLLVLTNQGENMRMVARTAGVAEHDMTLLNVPHSEVPRYLATADMGLLMRPAGWAGRVSSPVKFGEYLASGLPVIMNAGIGDYSKLAAETGVGVVLPSDQPLETRIEPIMSYLEAYLRAPEILRQRCRELAQRELSWDVYLPRIAELYARLTSPVAPS